MGLKITRPFLIQATAISLPTLHGEDNNSHNCHREQEHTVHNICRSGNSKMGVSISWCCYISKCVGYQRVVKMINTSNVYVYIKNFAWKDQSQKQCYIFHITLRCYMKAVIEPEAHKGRKKNGSIGQNNSSKYRLGI